jgi:hypothetical protein
MTQTISISLTESEYKCLQYVTTSPSDWSKNVVRDRARIASDAIIQIYTERALSEGIQIPLTSDLIIDDAFARGWVQIAQPSGD